jgi:hypothetical protein
VKEVIEKLEKAFQDVIHNFPDEAANKIRAVIAELKTPRWYTPEQWEAEHGEPYPREAPVWAVSKYAISDKSTKYNRLRWTLGTYGDMADCGDAIIFCAYGHFGPPPDDWKPEENV